MGHLKEYLELHGYWVLFLWTFIEGETGVLLAGLLAFQGFLHLPLVVATAFAGSFLGDQFLFHSGKKWGARVFLLFPSLGRRSRKALRLIHRYGDFVAFLSRFTYGFRIVLPIMLGMSPFRPRRFMALNLGSALAWSTLFSVLGYLFGKSASLFVGDLSRYEHYVVLALLALVWSGWLIHWLRGWKKRNRVKARLKRMRERR